MSGRERRDRVPLMEDPRFPPGSFYYLRVVIFVLNLVVIMQYNYHDTMPLICTTKFKSTHFSTMTIIMSC